jgi:hypothetical protein
LVSSIPPFTAEGLLPPDPHDAPYVCTVADVRKRFVDDLGAPSWRVELFEGWDTVRRGIAAVVPNAYWWLWGCFISSHDEPYHGDLEVMSALVHLPATPGLAESISVVAGYLRDAEQRHRLDVERIWHPDGGTPDAVWMMDEKCRPRAIAGVGDHSTGNLVHCGFVEVQP